ncbi:hypothetical protein QTP70_005677 [Hemibagrus guttatus]|uniref:Selectin P n=1 Tax=Hemibagrus guttatus TaxID=175788 RepID=A0AAE0Q926_9TELE|nr:hypothetical protein QTP70_005677 [Hemibagrus guttatus]
MVAIQNHGEIEYLNNMLPRRTGYYWIGIRKINNTWTWVGTKKHLTTEAENWATGEPNNGRNNEDCVEIYIKREEDNGKWNDESCQKEKTALCYTASCKKDSCSYQGECVETINSHMCDCFEGFYGVKCEHIVQCSGLNMTLNGTIVCNHPIGTFSYQSSCEFRCEEGYTLTGSSYSLLMCDASGQWNDSQPTCEAVRCPALEEPVDGRMSCSGDSYGSRCTFSCNVGFRLLGTSELTCTKTAQWNQETPSCRAVQCPVLQTPQNGSVSCTDQTLSKGSVCSFACSEGFNLEGASSTECTETGEWSTNIPSCTAVRCPALEEPVDGRMSCSGDSYGSRCTFSCNVGFRLLGTSELTCTKTAQWNQETPSCRAVQCPVLQTPQNGSVSCTDQTLSKGSVCSFSCSEGFNLEGASSTECTETGEWSTNIPSCTEVRCPHLQKPNNGLINCFSEPLFNTSCSFSCLDGYQLHGHKMVLCSLNGNWTGEVPECQAKKFDLRLQTYVHGFVRMCSVFYHLLLYVLLFLLQKEEKVSETKMFFQKHIGVYFGWTVLMIMVNNGVQAWTYHYSTNNMEWKMARQWCRQHHTDIVAIQNKEEVRHLDQVLPFRSSYYWIGLRKVAGQWTWMGTMKPLAPEATNWAKGEPNDRGTSEDCVEIYIKRSKDSGMWNDDKCSKLKAALCFTASCFKTSCSEHGECVENIGNYICKCNAGFTGPRCDEAVTCDPLVSPQKGIMNCTDPLGKFSFRSLCDVSCEEGYKLRGENNLTCLKTGNCDGKMNCSHPLSNNSYNSTCVFNCDEGFKLIGSNKTQCDHTGQWTPKTPTCKVCATPHTTHSVMIPIPAVTCDPLVSPQKGIMNCTDPLGKFSFRSSCNVSCEEGYKLRGENNLTCLKTGNWSAETPACEAVTCDPLVSPQKGIMNCTDPLGKFSFHSLCDVSCEEGYKLRGENNLTCLKTGTWCSALNAVPHGSMHCTDSLEKFAYGSVCRFECDVGFLLMGSNYTHCSSPGNWSHSLPVCQAVQCSPLSAHFSDGKMNCSHPLSNNSYNSTCVFNCDEGFKLIGSNKTQCDHTGQWTPKTPTCKAVTCDPLVSPQKGIMNCIDPLGKFSFHSLCDVSCEEGYKLRGENNLTCLKTENWCSALNAVPHGSMHCTDSLEKFAYGSVCRFECDVGFLLMGSNYTHCSSQGNWSHSLPVCQAVQCSPLSAHFSDGKMNCSHPLSNNSYNSTCVFNCDEGFKLIGSNKTQCDHTGQWTPKTPTCKGTNPALN